MAKGCEWCGISHDIKIAHLLNINIMYEYSIKTKICNNKVLFTASEDKIAKIIITLTKRKISVFGAGDVDTTLEDIFLNVVNDGKSDTGIK